MEEQAQLGLGAAAQVLRKALWFRPQVLRLIPLRLQVPAHVQLPPQEL